jgi:VIT1/CCC1 family predicted Fe2+/Mn2+ transporter
VHVREELGVDPDDLPSPWSAAGSSFVAFAVGALLPLLPFLFGASSVLPALLISAVALVVAGGIVARLTGRPVWSGSGRQLLMGAFSAAVTFGVGMLVGVGVS